MFERAALGTAERTGGGAIEVVATVGDGALAVGIAGLTVGDNRVLERQRALRLGDARCRCRQSSRSSPSPCRRSRPCRSAHAIDRRAVAAEGAVDDGQVALALADAAPVGETAGRAIAIEGTAGNRQVPVADDRAALGTAIRSAGRVAAERRPGHRGGGTGGDREAAPLASSPVALLPFSALSVIVSAPPSWLMPPPREP